MKLTRLFRCGMILLTIVLFIIQEMAFAADSCPDTLLFTFKTWIQEDEKYEYGLAKVDVNTQETKNIELEQEYYLIDSDEGSLYAVSTPAPDTVSLWEYRNGELYLLHEELNLPDLDHVIAYKDGYLYYHTEQDRIRRVNEQMDRYEYPESIFTGATVAVSPDGKVACHYYNNFCIQMPDGGVIDILSDAPDLSGNYSMFSLAWLDENTLLYWEYSRRFLNVTSSWVLKKYDITQRKSENFLAEKGKKIRLDEKRIQMGMTFNPEKNSVAFFASDASLLADFFVDSRFPHSYYLFTLDLTTGTFRQLGTYGPSDYLTEARKCILWDGIP